MRIAILGNSGSGKSTLARRLAATGSTPVLDLDTIVWEPWDADRGAVMRPEARILADLEAFCSATDRWIIEGCYADVVRASLRWEAELLFMNPSVEVCLRHCRERPWEPHKYRSKEEQDANLAFLLEWVADYYRRDGSMSLRAHREVFDGYGGKKREIVDEGGV
jgi:adenylate kinase family enzyme